MRSSRPATRSQLGAELVDLGGQPGVDVAEGLGVDADADVLHAGQHANERVLDRVVQVGHALGGEAGLDRLGDVVHGERVAGGPLGVADAGAVEVELAGRRPPCWAARTA